MITKIIRTERDKTFLHTLIDEMKCDGSKTVISKNTDKSPTAKQRGLQWKWYGEIAMSGLGADDEKNEVHIRAKYQFAIPIMLRDDVDKDGETGVFTDVYHGFKETIRYYPQHIQSESIKEFTRDWISTEDLTRKQRAEYLTEFQRFWISKGANLTDPSLQGVEL